MSGHQIKIKVNKSLRNSRSTRQLLSKDMEQAKDQSLFFYDFNGSTEEEETRPQNEPRGFRKRSTQALEQVAERPVVEYVKEIKGMWD